MNDPENSNEKTILLSVQEQSNTNNQFDKVKNGKDPLLVFSVEPKDDIYALTWNALRKSSWKDKEVLGVPITFSEKNEQQLIGVFLIFISLVIFTIVVLLYESFIVDRYKVATFQTVILRITLVAFAQKRLEPEMFQGLALLRYTRRKEAHFSHPTFAKFVAFMQIFIAVMTFIAIFLFCCMSNQSVELIMGFSGITVISDLDNWVGEQVMSETLHLDFKNCQKYKDKKVNVKDLNERMGLFAKMCLAADCIEVEDDQNCIVEENKFDFLRIVVNYIPWQLFPLMTLPCEYLFQFLQNTFALEQNLTVVN